MRARAVLFLLCAPGAAACASIWGFEDGVPGSTEAGIVDDQVTPAQGATGIVCVPQFPADWQGPLVIDEESSLPLAPKPCPAPYGNPIDAFAKLDAPNPCNCACSAPTAECAPPTLSVYTDGPGCNAGTACNTITPTKTCPLTDNYPPTGCAATNTVTKITGPAAVKPGASCQSTSDPIPPAQWGAAVRLCAPDPNIPGTCPPNKVPTPVAPVSYEVNYCIATTGLRECPSSYPAQRVYYKDKTDTRACSCSCGAPTGVTCSAATVTGWDNSGATCSGAQKPVPATGCSASMGNTSALVYTGAEASGGSCAPSGGPTGAATATQPTTICCRR